HRDGASDPRPLSLNAFDGLRPKRLRSCVFRLAGAFSWPPCDRGWRGYFACDLFIGVENVTNVGNGIIDEGHVRGRAGGGRAPKAWERNVPEREGRPKPGNNMSRRVRPSVSRATKPVDLRSMWLPSLSTCLVSVVTCA